MFIILISAQKHRLWVLFRTAFGEMVLTSTHNLFFEQKYEKYQSFYLKIFIFLVIKFSVYLNEFVFVMAVIWHNRKWLPMRIKFLYACS